MFWLKANLKGLGREKKKIHKGYRVATEKNTGKKKNLKKRTRQRRKEVRAGPAGWKETHRPHLQQRSWPVEVERV